MTAYVTGAAGFIGSVIHGTLNAKWIDDIVLIDDLDESEKWKNLVGKRYRDYFDRKDFLAALRSGAVRFEPGDRVIHMGAISATTERDSNELMHNNAKYTLELFRACQAAGASFVYASSAATYGNGERGYDDRETDLKPLNMYGYSKHMADLWILRETENFTKLAAPVAGLKFFNVYGPNEYHKGSMASVVFHSFNQIRANGFVSLFTSFNPNYGDGRQMRDFVYVKDCADVAVFLSEGHASGIFNVGTGKARPFYDLAAATFDAMGVAPDIRFTPMPEHLREKYQYFTEAKMDSLRQAGYEKPFRSLEEGVADYVRGYLMKDGATY